MFSILHAEEKFGKFMRTNLYHCGNKITFPEVFEPPTFCNFLKSQQMMALCMISQKSKAGVIFILINIQYFDFPVQ